MIELPQVKGTLTNYTTTIRRLRNCAICPHRFIPDAEQCSHCPPYAIMKGFDLIIRYYFACVKEAKQERNVK